MRDEGAYLLSRAGAHYLLAFGGMVLFGIQACDCIVLLPIAEWMVIVVVALAAGYGLRVLLQRALVLATPPIIRSRRQFVLELGLFVLMGLTIGIFDYLAYGYPAGSGFKVVAGFSAFGFFAGADLALAREIRVAHEFDDAGVCIEPEARYFSLPQKLAVFVSICALFIAFIVAAIVVRDVQEILEEGLRTDFVSTKRALWVEVGAVFGVLLAEVVNLSASYARNLRYFFRRQTGALEEVTRGRLDSHVPVSTSDEFGLIAKHTNHMIETLRDRTEALEKTQDATLTALASLAESRDEDTGAHILRTQAYVEALAEALREHPRFRDDLDDARIRLLLKCAPLHDIGKVGIPDAILLKPARLTPEEFVVMKRHAEIGAETLRKAEARLGSNSFLRLAREIAETHHEKWDGSGYPRGLAGDAIPLSGRLMALADVYDALISKRCYKEAFSHEKAAAIILEGRGVHFDPDVTDTFDRIQDRFRAIAAELPDT